MGEEQRASCDIMIPTEPSLEGFGINIEFDRSSRERANKVDRRTETTFGTLAFQRQNKQNQFQFLLVRERVQD